MSAEEAATDALNAPVDQNAAAAEDAKKLLAELDAEETTTADATLKPESNGATNGDKADEQEPTAESKSEETEKTGEKADRSKGRDFKRRDDRRDNDHRGGRGGGRGGRFNKQGGIKSVLTREEKSDDPVSIRKQVEFYFSDSNLPLDKFLFEKVGGSENNPVEISLIRTFKRMRHFEPLEAIVNALKESNIVQLVNDDTKVQRKVPLSIAADEGLSNDHLKVYEDKAMPRSVYVKGFGQEVPSTQFDIEAWFAEFGTTNAIRLRRADDKTFKGSVFAEFETEDTAKAFLALDPKPKYNDRELQIMSKKEYCEKKVEDIKAGRIKAGRDRARDSPRGRGRGAGRDGRNRRDHDDNRDWRKRRDEDVKNGFKDDRRRSDRDRDRRGGRDRRRSFEKDDRGIPVVKTTVDPEEREKQKAEALARAKAVVEKQSQLQKEQKNGASTEVKTEGSTGAAAAAGEADKTNLKREREEEAGSTATEEPAAKKVDLKEEA